MGVQQSSRLRAYARAFDAWAIGPSAHDPPCRVRSYTQRGTLQALVAHADSPSPPQRRANPCPNRPLRTEGQHGPLVMRCALPQRLSRDGDQHIPCSHSSQAASVRTGKDTK